MVLSLSPGPTAIEHANEVISLAQMWRISNDIWDVWSTSASFPKSVKDQFAQAAKWSSYAGPGHWPDADMLPLGELAPYPDVGNGARHTRLTPDEQRTMVTLWAFARSPLIVGANLTELDSKLFTLLTNKDILRIDQTALASREVRHDADTIIWTSELPGGKFGLAFFNIGDAPSEGAWKFADLGLQRGKVDVRNVRQSTVQDQVSGLKVHLEPHSTVAFVLDGHPNR